MSNYWEGQDLIAESVDMDVLESYMRSEYESMGWVRRLIFRFKNWVTGRRWVY